jgi:hypothetical protein
MRSAGTPALDVALASLGPLPEHGALLGIASEGTPVMLNLRDATPGPLLVVGDAGSGKTGLLRFTAAALSRTHFPTRAQFCVLTTTASEWDELGQCQHCLGILDPRDSTAGDALGWLMDMIYGRTQGRAMLLLVDDLTSLMPDALDALSRILLEGPAAGLWPLVTVNTYAALQWLGYLGAFQTRIFGRISEKGAAGMLAPAPDGGLNNLLAGAQFCLRSQGHWLRFWTGNWLLEDGNGG